MQPACINVTQHPLPEKLEAIKAVAHKLARIVYRMLKYGEVCSSLKYLGLLNRAAS